MNYSSCNEDWRTERRALRVGPADRLLAVTGSGDRPLNLLVDDPASVTAVDANESQTHLLRLKIAALGEWTEYRDYASFLGLLPSERRDFAPLQNRLDPSTRDYWLRHLDSIEAGVLYEGRWERYYRRVSSLARLMRGDAIHRLFEFRDLEEQRSFVHEVWDQPWWRRTLDLLCSRTTSRVFLGDPAFYANVDPAMRIGRYIHRGMLEILRRYLARENFMLSLLFRGRLSEDDLPPYLHPESVPILRTRVGRIESRTENLMEVLHRVPEGSFTRFSLSDVPSYLDAPAFERLLDGLVRAAAPGARFCIREFLTAHPVPSRFERVLRREPDLEDELRGDDRAFAYRFLVGSVVK